MVFKMDASWLLVIFVMCCTLPCATVINVEVTGIDVVSHLYRFGKKRTETFDISPCSHVLLINIMFTVIWKVWKYVV